MLVFSLYLQTFRMVLESFSHGFYDGTLHLNFRTMPSTGKGFSLERYVTGVTNELLWALEGLVEERKGVYTFL